MLMFVTTDKGVKEERNNGQKQHTVKGRNIFKIDNLNWHEYKTISEIQGEKTRLCIGL